MVCLLRELPGPLLSQVWPASRLVVGMKVAKWLRSELEVHAVAAKLVAKAGQTSSREIQTDDVCNDLTRFSKDQRLQLHAVNVTCFSASAIIAAIVKILQPTPTLLPSAHATEQAANFASSLVEIELGRIARGEEEVLPFFKVLGRCSNMQRLSIKEFWICDEAKAQLFEAIAGYESLTHLEFSWLYLGDEGAEKLAQALTNCKHLSHLVLHHNHIGCEGVEALADMLSHCKSATHVNLRHNDLSATEATARKLGAALQQCAKLTLLDLSHCNLDDRHVTQFLHAFSTPQALQHLLLHNNAFSAPAVEALSAISWPSLRSLQLDGHVIGDAGAAALAASLPRFKALRSLGLSRCEIGQQGGAALAHTLPHCPELTHLNLGWNCIEQGGAEALAAVLGKCPAVTDLRLSANRIGEGVAALAMALPACAKLKRLDLRSNGVTETAAAALAREVAKAPQSLAVDLRWNKFAHTDWMRALPVGHGDGGSHGANGAVLRLH